MLLVNHVKIPAHNYVHLTAFNVSQVQQFALVVFKDIMKVREFVKVAK